MVTKKSNKVMFLQTPNFHFLNIINYLGPDTCYGTWVKVYRCSPEKLCLYEWFDSVDQLDFLGLDYATWYSKLREKFVLALSEWKQCKHLFRDKGMTTFADWLQHYSNLDVAPGLEALEKM